MKLVEESLSSFKRGLEPKEAMGTDESKRRVFKDFQEAAEWCLSYPNVVTNGSLKAYTLKDAYQHKVQMMKWIMNNLQIEGHKTWLTLKEAQTIVGIVYDKINDDFWEPMIKRMENNE